MNDAVTDSQRDYRDTVFLPQTSFPMRGDLPKKEPQILAKWDAVDLWSKLRAAAAERPLFILHDGPPYANGHLHIGTALNKILKDVINRTRQMAGYNANYIPGWDCHGLPIEWKIEEEYRARKQDKDAVPILDFRAECRAYANHWMDVQRQEFRRLGVEGAWGERYATMDYPSEAAIAAEICKFLLNGSLYRGLRPVMWSPVEKTALAEAEIEYHDHTSTTIWVRFPVVKASVPALEGAAVVIWTTTPWTMPGNRAVAAGAEFDYAVVQVDGVAEGSLARAGEKIVVAEALLPTVLADTGITAHTVLATLKGAELADTILAHPLRGQGYEQDTPLLLGDFVTTEAGTGFVHIAPGHGEDDFILGRAHGLDIPETVGDDGTFNAWVPLFAGAHVYKAADPVCAALQGAGNLLARGKIVHSYPCSWRSKAPLIFRATPQWFIPMDGPHDIRGKALAAIAITKFVPDQGRNRIGSMVASRPDWCISRQRAWGVPITVFVEKRTGQPLRDPAVVQRIVAAFEKEGADTWYSSPPSRFLGPDYNPDEYEQVMDIVDVWFESGSTHAFVLEKRGLPWPADLYLEGSDQHRGWFHSSLLEAVGTRGRAPFKAVLTHGFVNDEKGRKMSKSLGNTVAPEEVAAKFGVDILRLWVMSSDTTEDLRIGPEILKQQAELYRRLRNTLRWVLGSLHGFSEAECVPEADMPELERWVLHRLTELDARIRASVESYDWTGVYPELHNFCAVDLSAFYFDIRKDAIYCDRPDSLRRRAARTVLDHLHRCLCTWLAPVLCFTAEEAWTARFGADSSVHLELFPVLPAHWRDEALAARWETIRGIRRRITIPIEEARKANLIGSSLQAAVELPLDEAHQTLLDEAAWAEIAIVSSVKLGLDTGEPLAKVTPAPGEKCVRCWRVLPEVGTNTTHPTLCLRCADAVESGLVCKPA
ncbi:isoleucine--tRNA ligase [Rhodopila globiformis]|uniref:Isoleucine--tRNA ligase n=1 Tax=Rhodopila globiformis TaxID=1071 RepID=A0A2S6NK92_RHOGL|nr:isoleucine--tRNA ligase [Rhodopila globiformis]PPQ35279.1 isoleucine--tRNA ligase [Rhodopila globiformis]